MLDGAFLGVCDKIVPGWRWPRLLAIFTRDFVPSGPMAPGPPNKEKSVFVSIYAEGKVDRMALLESEAASLPCAGHLYILRHRQHQPDGGGVYAGNAAAGFFRLCIRMPPREALTAVPPQHVR